MVRIVVARPISLQMVMAATALLGGWALLAGCTPRPEKVDARSLSPSRSIVVTYEIEFHGRAENLKGQWDLAPGGTVADLLQELAADNRLSVKISGAGETAFVKSIGGVANEGPGGGNWIYRVNGALGDRSCGVFGLAHGDEVNWTIGQYPGGSRP